MNQWVRQAFLSKKLGRLQSAEQRLLDLSRRWFQRETLATNRIVPFDTKIPRSVVPIHHQNDTVGRNEAYRLHALRILNTNTSSTEDEVNHREDTSLVMLHGYMAGAAYFYRNFAGLSNYFRNTYSVDLMGWGLSSRPPFSLIDGRVETAEDFFVETLEAWRRKNGIGRMILAGHSMGGYISVAYCGKI